MSEDSKFNPTKYKNDFQKQKYDRLIVNVPKGKGDIIKAHAKSKGKSLNAYVVDLINADMESNTILRKIADIPKSVSAKEDDETTIIW